MRPGLTSEDEKKTRPSCTWHIRPLHWTGVTKVMRMTRVTSLMKVTRVIRVEGDEGNQCFSYSLSLFIFVIVCVFVFVFPFVF